MAATPGRFYYDADSWIQLPPTWLGHHVQRRDEIIAKLPEGTGPTETVFAVAMALLDDWQLPGLPGNPEKWDFSQIPLNMIAWVNTVTMESFWACWQVKKNYSPPSANGLTSSQEPTENQPGNLNVTS